MLFEDLLVLGAKQQTHKNQNKEPAVSGPLATCSKVWGTRKCSHSALGSQRLQTLTSGDFSALPSPTIAQSSWSAQELVISLPPVSWALIKPQQGRRSLTSFSWGQPLLRRTECSGVFQNSSLSSPPARSMRRFFLNIHCKAPEGEIHRSVGTHPRHSPWS